MHFIMQLWKLCTGDERSNSVSRRSSYSRTSFCDCARYTIRRKKEGEWVAVALYGTIGAPVKGSEHEAIGLGINHI